MIEVKDLNLYNGNRAILQNISFSLKEKRVLGIIGSSGAGKSTLAKALLRLHHHSLKLNAQKLKIFSFDVLALKQKELQALRTQVGFVPADVYANFYPLADMGEIFDLLLSTHTTLQKKERKEKAFELLSLLGFKDLDLLWHSYIHQLSGGMAKRVHLALALSCGAKCLICDEITSSLDERNEKRILDYLKKLKDEISFVFITHNPLVLQELCDEVLVLQKGTIIEQRLVEDFFLSPYSAYGKELLKEWSYRA